MQPLYKEQTHDSPVCVALAAHIRFDYVAFSVAGLCRRVQLDVHWNVVFLGVRDFGGYCCLTMVLISRSCQVLWRHDCPDTLLLSKLCDGRPQNQALCKWHFRLRRKVTNPLGRSLFYCTSCNLGTLERRFPVKTSRLMAIPAYWTLSRKLQSA